jgi:hypothetical protein
MMRCDTLTAQCNALTPLMGGPRVLNGVMREAMFTRMSHEERQLATSAPPTRHKRALDVFGV